MSEWTPPPKPGELQAELRELSRERSPGGVFHRRWYAAAFAAGVLLVCALGFATDIFDSGPSSADVSAAYRAGLDEGTAAAEAYWQEELESRWWESYKAGKSEGSSIAPTLVIAVHEGFSWEGGYEAGLRSPDIDIEQSYRQGWMAGYSRAWSTIAGEVAVAPFNPSPPSVGVGQRVQWVEWGGEP